MIVKRYTPTQCCQHDGTYVSYTDYQELEKKLKAERQRADAAEIAAKPYKNIAEAGVKEIAEPNAPVEIDATALIAEHRISIHFDEQKPNLNQPFVMRYVNCIAEGRDEGSCEPLGSDPKSALRRAISRAALERKS